MKHKKTKKKICQWARLNHGISTLCGKETQFYGEDMKYCPFCANKIVYKVMPKTLREVKEKNK